MKVVFSNRAYAAIMAETAEKIETETGGLFLGAFAEGTFYVVEAIDPGPNAIFQVAYFEYDRPYTEHLINKMANLYECGLSLIGLWHRHPGSLDKFSLTDNGTNARYAAMAKHGAISALVNVDPEFRLTVYGVKPPCRYTRLTWQVGDEHIPDSLLCLKSPEQFTGMMHRLQNSGPAKLRPSLSAFMRRVAPFLPAAAQEVQPQVQPNADALVELLLDDLLFLADTQGIACTVQKSDRAVLLQQQTEDGFDRLRIALDETGQPALQYDSIETVYTEGLLQQAFKAANNT